MTMATNSPDSQEEATFQLDDMSQESKTETRLTHVAFAVFGFVIYVLFSVNLSTAQDALQGTFIPSSAVTVLMYFCTLLAALTLPQFIHRVPQSVLLLFVLVSMGCGQILYVVADHVAIRLVGVFLASIGQAVAEVGNVSLSALYSEKAMSWFAFGTGLGFFTGPLYFAGMTTVACVSPRTTVLITCVLPLAYLLSYVIMEKKHYSHKSDEACDEHLTCNEKLALMCQNLRGVAAFCVGAFVEYLILGSIVTTLAFQNSPFNPRDHYVYYVLMITMGEFIGRSYISMFSICTRKHSLAVRQTWIFSGAMLILGTLLGFAAWYRFLPNIGLVLVLVLAIGILNGMLYINTILSAAQDEDSRSKVFSRGFSMLGVAVGSIIAALLGLLLEPVLRGHCMEVSSSDQFCFTRPMSAWNSSDSCMTH